MITIAHPEHSSGELKKGDKTRSKKGRVVILVCDKLSGPVLHFCQISLKYSKGYSSYRHEIFFK